MEGRVNSVQSMGAVDGPGLRFVVFLQGCPLRCIYCHNPDTWDYDAGEAMDPEDILAQAKRCRPYFGTEGGVTISGGEPLLQWEFTAELLKRLKAEGFHTALDTSGIGEQKGAAEVLSSTDLVLCDLKFPTEEGYRKYCGGSLEQVLSFLKLTEEKQIPLWIRHVVVPGLTDGRESLAGIRKLAGRFSNLEKLELLPFRKLCIPKYESLEIPFPLSDTEECSGSLIRKLMDI